MQKNQNYSKEQMYRSIALWRESGLSQYQFCKREKLSVSTFSYWLRKYRKEKGLSKPSRIKPVKAFIPVEISNNKEPAVLNTGQIKITYPNGIKVSCAASISIHQLKTLISK